MIGLSKLFPKSPRFGRYNMTFLDENETAEVDSVVGAFMLVRTEAIAGAGLMDERFWMYGEDLDWAKRIKDRGWKVVYYPEVTVLHVKRASSRQSLGRSDRRLDGGPRRPRSVRLRRPVRRRSRCTRAGNGNRQQQGLLPHGRR